MSHATLDRLLAVLVVAMAATGLLSLRTGAATQGWLFVAHGFLAGVLAVAVGLKLAGSVPRAIAGRRWARLALASIVSLAVVAALVGGFAWVAGGELLTVGSLTVLTLHAWIGLVLVPLVVVHLLPRRWRLLRPARSSRSAEARLSRRSVLTGAGLALGGFGLFGLANALETIRGGEGRFTGSRWLASGGVPPVTTFYGEAAPTLDVAAWRLRVRGPGGVDRSWSLPELRGLGERNVAAVLDCTSGWAIETGWRGVPLATVLEASGVQAMGRASIRVTAVTGWGAVLTMAEAPTALLATEVAGHPLPAANGAPCRLVVPDRRGLDWVKWVSEIRVD
jgi:DMSO/TMAO reductase YedYZ molybdopterin-dependent catalytic subunit